MLKPKKPIERLDHITQENPCFTIHSDDSSKLYIHVYRKGTRGKMRETECYFDKDCMPDFTQEECSSCHTQCGGTCGNSLITMKAEQPWYTEWHEAEGCLKKFCLTDQLFHALDGVWMIDVYRDVEYLDDTHASTDPTNFYRTGQGCTKIGKDLCKQYEFNIGCPCDEIEIEPCKTHIMG